SRAVWSPVISTTQPGRDASLGVRPGPRIRSAKSPASRSAACPPRQRKARPSIAASLRGLTPARDALARAFGQSDAQVTVDNLDRHGPQAQARVALVTPR